MSLHVAHVGGLLDAQRRPPAALLEAWPTLVEVADAVRRAGVRVTVIQAAADDARIERNGVQFRFVRVRDTHTGALRVAAATRDAAPDVIHVHGFVFPLHVAALRRALPRVPILAQDHADVVARGLRGVLQRRMLRGLDAVAFTAAALADPFRPLLRPNVKLVEVPGSSSHFSPGDRSAARDRLGVNGGPCIAWVSRLAPSKDPQGALAIFRRVLDHHPEATLLYVYKEAALLTEVERLLSEDAVLAARVRTLGPLERRDVETVMQAADVFLSTSRSEATGFAVVEAMACGTPAVTTDIPAFRALSGSSAVGALYPVGDHAAGAAAVCTLLAQPADRARVRRHFEERLSFGVIGNALRVGYEELHRTRTRMRVCLLVPGGVDRSGEERTIPCVLALVERLARAVDVHVIALALEDEPCTYSLCGATVECVPRGDRLAGVRAVLRAHRDRPFDVLHAIWLHKPGTTAALASALLRRPLLLHLTGGDLADLPAVPYGRMRTPTGRMLLRGAAARATRVTAPSAAFVERARRFGVSAERVTLGVDVARWPARAPRPRASTQRVHLLSVADINPVKDHRTLLHAFALLCRRGHDVELDCVGLDTLDGMAQRLAAELGIGDRVRFHGFVPHRQLRAFFDAAHIFVVSSWHEGDPVAALEAAIAGVAVAGTRVGHLEEWTPQGAVTCEPGDAAGLANAIETLIADEPRRVRTAAHAQRIALAHDADAAATRVLRIYDEISGRNDDRAELRTAD